LLFVINGYSQTKPNYVDILDIGSKCSSFATAEIEYKGVGGGEYGGFVRVMINGKELGRFDKGGNSASLYRFFRGKGGKIDLTFETKKPIYLLVRRLDLKANSEEILFKKKFEHGSFEFSLIVDKNGVIENGSSESINGSQ
jgi:hypothetical protein